MLHSPGSHVLNVYRAANIDLTDSRLLVSVNVSGQGSVTLPISLAAGETLYGELATDTRSNAASVAETGLSAVRFTIRRAAPPGAPTITTAPRSQTVVAGSDVTLTVEATGTNLGYQWSKNGSAVTGATTSSLQLKAVQPADAGSYTVTISNAGVAVTSPAAEVAVVTRPSITASPASHAVVAGTRVSFEAGAAGTPPFSYQWLKNGAEIAGATASAFTLSSPRSGDAGAYSVRITNAAGSVTSASGLLEVLSVSRITNLSIRCRIDAAAALTVGMTVGRGDTTAGKPLLIRAVGPTLAAFGVSDAAENPRVAIQSGSRTVAENDDWAGSAVVRTTSQSVGAFALANDVSKDAAIAHAAEAGSYTAQIAPAAGPGGVVLAEIYDATPGAEFVVSTPRLINLSALTNVGTEADVLIAGFSVTGSRSVTVLVRAIGPTLAGFGVGGALANPRLELFASGSATPISFNDDWGTATNAAQVAAGAAGVGAFPLALESKDAALLVTLPPGSYTAQVIGVNNTTGAALVEVYEMP